MNGFTALGTCLSQIGNAPLGRRSSSSDVRLDFAFGVGVDIGVGIDIEIDIDFDVDDTEVDTDADGNADVDVGFGIGSSSGLGLYSILGLFSILGLICILEFKLRFSSLSGLALTLGSIRALATPLERTPPAPPTAFDCLDSDSLCTTTASSFS